MSNKIKFQWIDTKKNIFKEINIIVDRNTLFSYAYFNKIFQINTDDKKFTNRIVCHY